MKIYTRGGDLGETDLFGHERRRKDDPRVAAFGDVDELQALLGVARANLQTSEHGLHKVLISLQNELFSLAAELASSQHLPSKVALKEPRLQSGAILRLERLIDRYELTLLPIKSFVRPGGSLSAANLNHARTVCRRAERSVVRLAHTEKVRALLIRYLNRASDLLFVLSRVANQMSGYSEELFTRKTR